MAKEVKRTYFDDRGSYYLPNDSQEHERLDGQSKTLVALMGGRPFHAPLSEPKKILDVGCGTGTMTAMLATLYPDARVIGVDISAVPASGREQQARLPNLEFVQGDIRELARAAAEDENQTDAGSATFAPGTFDFVFERLLVFGVTDWAGHVDVLARLLRPGRGWLECQEVSMQLFTEQHERIAPDAAWYRHWLRDAGAVGLDVEVGPKLERLLRHCAAGLDAVTDRSYRFAPVARPDRPELDGLGDHLLPVLTAAYRHLAARATRTPDEVEEAEREMRAYWEREFVEGDHFKIHVATGRRRAI